MSGHTFETKLVRDRQTGNIITHIRHLPDGEWLELEDTFETEEECNQYIKGYLLGMRAQPTE